MTKIIMHGCNGAMGQVITKLVAKDANCEIVAGVDRSNHIENTYPVYSDLNDIKEDGQVIIDFSNPKALGGLLDYGIKTEKPLVLCTTGFNEEDVKSIYEAGDKAPILYSRNMSLGINLLLNLVKKATEILTPAGFDIEIVEKHHNQKIDAPSGTALALADSINETLDNTYNYNFDRSTQRVKRNQKEIGIHAVRGGTIVGEHSIIFAGEDEVIELNHTAYSKDVFAVGAVNAAKFLVGKTPGIYTMSDVVE